MADPQIRSSGNFTCVITINLPACDSSGLGIVAVCWSSKNQGALLLIWEMNLLRLEWGKGSLVLLAIAQSNFLLGLVLAILRRDYWKCYCWYRFFNFICPTLFGCILGNVRWACCLGWSPCLWKPLLCQVCLRHLVSPRSVLRITERLQPPFVSLLLWKEKLSGGCDLGGKGTCWAKQDLFLKSSDFKSQDGVRLLNSCWSHVSLWSSHRDRFRVCWWRCSSSSCRNICCWYAK